MHALICVNDCDANADVSMLNTRNDEGPSRGTQLAVLSCNEAVTDIVKDLLFL